MKRQTWAIACCLVLAACQQRQSPPAQSQPAASAKPSVELPNTPEPPPKPGAEATPEAVLAAKEVPVEQVAPAQPLLPPGDCSFTLHAGDAPAWDAANIDVPNACETFTIKLEHTGKMPRWIMGHNVIVAKMDDMNGVERAGIGAGPYRSYVEPSDKRVVARSKLAGGGESVSATFPVARLHAGHFAYFCTFPGHFKAMHGTLTLH
ncbi:azurin [Solilutibacter silvestris]|uniref:Azurin n=1 Tax=Solilutibacter silvestris TaxID=1645665 RepID=A0A2K1PZL4_9GAMM|nr:azurin [Lysobacter silvestris]PNS08231.1 azurin [Lysobacter silvestris]